MSELTPRTVPTTAGAVQGGYLATVTQVDWVRMTCAAKVHGIHAGFEHRDITIAEGPWVKGHRVRPTTIAGGGHAQFSGDGIHDHGPHRHDSGLALKAGDTVVVLPIYGFRDRLVLIARINIA